MHELKELLQDQGQAFQEFKENNDGALSDIKNRLFDLEKKAGRPGAASYSGAQDSVQTPEVKDFTQYVVSGTKSMNVTTDADGGYAVPEQLDKLVLNLLQDESPMRRICTVKRVTTGDYKKVVNLGGHNSGWVGESDARPETQAPKLAELTPFMGEIYANPAATQTFLDDAMFNLSDFMSENIVREFSLQEGGPFITGTGTKQPKGVLTYPSTADADADRDFGTLQHLVTAGATAILPDELVSLVYSLRGGHRTGAVWMMNSATAGYIRKLKDANGLYIWRQGLSEGQPETLLGYRVEIDENMPDIGADAVPVMFGNFLKGYTIVDRNTAMLRDPYTNKPYVHFYATKRVGGMLTDSDAIKLLKMAAA